MCYLNLQSIIIVILIKLKATYKTICADACEDNGFAGFIVLKKKYDFYEKK